MTATASLAEIAAFARELCAALLDVAQDHPQATVSLAALTLLLYLILALLRSERTKYR